MIWRSLIEKWWFWVIATFLLYANTLKHDYVIDDLIVVTNNKLTQEGVSAIPEIFSHSYLFGYDGREDESYRPITLTTFAIERTLFDADPFFSHLIQVLLYGVTILLLFRLLQLMFGEEKWKLTLLIAGLYMLHPIHTEVVANVKSRDELLCALFLFAALLLFLKAYRKGNKLMLASSLGVYILALLSKETAAPAIVLFPAILWFFEKTSLKQTVLHSLPFVLPALVYIGLRSVVLSDVLIADPIDPVANSLVLAETFSESFASKLLVFTKYIQLSIFPVSMSWDYSISAFPIVGFSNFQSILGFVILISMLGLLAYGVLKRSAFGFASLVFLSTFVATSNFFFLINCVLGERFLFIPVLGILILLVLFLEPLLSRFHVKGALVLFGAIAFFYGSRTIIRNRDWKDNITIYEAGVAVVPNSVKTQFNLGTAYLTAGNSSSLLGMKSTFYDKALECFDAARRIYPNYPNIYENEAYVFGELAKMEPDTLRRKSILLLANKKLGFAIDSLNLKKDNLNQNRSFILTELIAIEQNSLTRIRYLEALVKNVNSKSEFTDDDFHNELYALYELGKKDKLLQVVQTKATEHPAKADLLAEISRQYFAKNDLEQSLAVLSEYLKLRPEDFNSKSNQGMLFEMMGKKQEAIKAYEAVLQQHPEHEHTRQLYESLKNKL
jgi:protein O-mannosyl-transferase